MYPISLLIGRVATNAWWISDCVADGEGLSIAVGSELGAGAALHMDARHAMIGKKRMSIRDQRGK